MSLARSAAKRWSTRPFRFNRCDALPRECIPRYPSNRAGAAGKLGELQGQGNVPQKHWKARTSG